MNTLNFEIKKEKTLCVTGHRTVKDDLDVTILEQTFLQAIKEGYDTFLVGMAVGYDTICFQILEKIREKEDVKIVACIPCPNQDKMFSIEQKIEYKRMVDSADGTVLTSSTYTKYCMSKRNRFMVDNSSRVLAYLKQDHGGTFSTVKYAKEKGIECIILPKTVEII